MVKQAAWLVAAGSTIGLAVAFLGAKVASGMLYQVSPADPAAILASLLMIAALTFAAAHFPARRAVRLDPMTVLRRGTARTASYFFGAAEKFAFKSRSISVNSALPSNTSLVNGL